MMDFLGSGGNNDNSSFQTNVSTTPTAKGLKQLHMASTLKDRRQNNEQLNVLIDARVQSLTRKMKSQMGMVGKITEKLRSTQEQLATIKADISSPGSIHNRRCLNFAMDVGTIDGTNLSEVCEFVRLSIPRLFQSVESVCCEMLMVDRDDKNTIKYVQDTESKLNKVLSHHNIQLLSDEVVSSRHVVRHALAEMSGAVDTIILPLHSPSSEVVALLFLVVTDTTSTFDEADVLTLQMIALLLSLSTNIAGKTMLRSKLLVDDQVRQIQTHSVTTAQEAVRWRKVAEASHFLFGLESEKDLFDVENMIIDSCGADSACVYILDPRANCLVGRPEKGEKKFIDSENDVYSCGGQDENTDENTDVYLSTVMATKSTLHKETKTDILTVAPIKVSSSILGVVKISKAKITDRIDALVNGPPSSSSKRGLHDSNFAKEDLVVLNFICALIGSKVSEMRGTEETNRDLLNRCTVAELQVEKLRGKEKEKKEKLSASVTQMAEENKSLKHESARLKKQLEALKRFGEKEEKRRGELERVVERCKQEKREELGGCRREHSRTEGELKSIINTLRSKNDELTKKTAHQQRQMTDATTVIKKLTKERDTLLSEKDKWKMDGKGFSLLRKAHEEIARQVKLLEAMRHNSYGEPPPRGSRSSPVRERGKLTAQDFDEILRSHRGKLSTKKGKRLGGGT